MMRGIPADHVGRSLNAALDQLPMLVDRLDVILSRVDAAAEKSHARQHTPTEVESVRRFGSHSDRGGGTGR